MKKFKRVFDGGGPLGFKKTQESVRKRVTGTAAGIFEPSYSSSADLRHLGAGIKPSSLGDVFSGGTENFKRKDGSVISGVKTMKPIGVGLSPNIPKGPFLNDFTKKEQRQLARKVYGTDINASFDKIKPFVSNLINAFSRPPKPAAPRMISSVSLPKISLDNQRNLVERNARSTDLAAMRTMDGSSAGAVMAANLGQKVQGLNDIAEKEAQIEANRMTSQTQMNSNIEAANAGSFNKYQDDVTNSVIARQQQSAANLANAVDKSIAIDNEEAKMALERDKLGIMARQYDEGVFSRLLGYLSNKGYKVPGMEELLANMEKKQRYGGRMYKKAFGGPLEETPKKPSAEARKATQFAKDFAVRHKLIMGSDAHTGGTVPAFVTPEGRPYVAPPARRLPTSLPGYVKPGELQQSGGTVWYTDPFTGDAVDVHPSLIRRGPVQMSKGGSMKRKWKSAY